MYIKRILKICDLYGTKFHWNIGYKPKYYTYYGGIFSILSLASWIIVFMVFGLEDFQRTHPIINTSTIPPNGYRNIKFGEQKLYLPWRIVNFDEKPINHKGILYPKIYYFNSRYNNETGAMKTNYTLLNYKLCNETSMKDLGNEFLLDIAIEELYCIDMEDLDIGGSWNSEFMNYVRFDLYLCKDGIDYNETNHDCTKYKELEDLPGGDNSLFFELLYPEVQFQPAEINMPILILYKSYYYIFSRYSNKLDRIYLQEHIMEDEQGWIFNKHQFMSYWGTHSIRGDNYVTGEKDIMKKGSNSRLYSLDIYLSLGITYYTRTYKKLYEILSEIFPLIRTIVSFFSFLSDAMNELNSSKKLNEFIIGIDKKKKKPKNKSSIKILQDLNPFNSSNKNNNFMFRKTNGNSFKVEEFNHRSVLLNNIDDSSKLYCLPINNNGNKKDNKANKKKSTNTLMMALKKNFNNNSHTVIDINKNKINNFDNIEKIKFPLTYYLLGFFLIKIKSRKFKNFCISEKFSKSFIFYSRLIDISTFITLFKQFEQFKKIVSNKLRINEDDISRKEDLLFRNTYKFSNCDKLSHKVTNIRPLKSITLINRNNF
jgi:hypothetical protein